MPKDTKSLGNNKAPACESRGFVRKKKKVCFLTHLLFCIESAIITQLSEFLQQLLPSEPLQQEQLLLQQPLSWHLKNDDDGLPSF